MWFVVWLWDSWFCCAVLIPWIILFIVSNGQAGISWWTASEIHSQSVVFRYDPVSMFVVHAGGHERTSCSWSSPWWLSDGNWSNSIWKLRNSTIFEWSWGTSESLEIFCDCKCNGTVCFQDVIFPVLAPVAPPCRHVLVLQVCMVMKRLQCILWLSLLLCCCLSQGSLSPESAVVKLCGKHFDKPFIGPVLCTSVTAYPDCGQ